MSNMLAWRDAYAHDLFINYSHGDNENRWVQSFVHAVSERLAAVLGHQPRIWLDRASLDSRDNYSAEAERALHASALLVTIVSPSFFASKWCTQELHQFAQTAGVSRILKVTKYPTDQPFPIPGLLDHRFYRRTKEGLIQELDSDSRRFLTAIDELTQQIRLLFGSLTFSTVADVPPSPRIEVFLCHSSGDKVKVRGLWERMKADGLAPWLDEKELLPGHRWEIEIRKAIDRAGAIVVCLSNSSVNKEGFLQREIRLVLDKASEKPDDAIFLIPTRLEPCPVPGRLKEFQWVNLFEDSGYSRLLQALQSRAAALHAGR